MKYDSVIENYNKQQIQNERKPNSRNSSNNKSFTKNRQDIELIPLKHQSLHMTAS